MFDFISTTTAFEKNFVSSWQNYEEEWEGMKLEKKRLTFACWKEGCKRNFSLFIQEASTPTIYVECPFCGVECVANLDPYQRDITKVYRGDSSDEKSIGKTWDFPEAIPTTAPEAR